MVREVYLPEVVLGWISGGYTRTKPASGGCGVKGVQLDVYKHSWDKPQVLIPKPAA